MRKHAIVAITLGFIAVNFHLAFAQKSVSESRVTIKSEDWNLIGDLRIPKSKKSLPVVLMLNKADGDRKVYEELAGELSKKGIASLRLDLRGHGESINLGKFIPNKEERSSMIWDAERDVIAAHQYLKNHPKLDSTKIGIIGGSYSGEEMAEAGRLSGYAQAYVALSPGSFSDESIAGIDQSNVPWLFIASNNERYLKEITAEVQAKSQTVELIILPGPHHATRILSNYKGISERIALWISQRLSSK